MRLLVAPNQPGTRPGDFTWTVPGELVIPALTVCERDRLDPDDGACGCGRSFVGLSSEKGTSTALVADVDIDLQMLTDAVQNFDAALQLATIGAEWPLGTTVRCRLGEVQPGAVA